MTTTVSPILAGIGLLVLAIGAALAAEPSVSKTGIGPRFKGPVGLQLYSLRNEFARNVPKTMAQVRDFGIRNVELAGTYDQAPDQFKEQLTANRLRPISGHFPYDRFRDDLDNVVREAKILGLRYAGIAWIPHEGAFNEQKCREAIGVFNRAGQALAKQHIRFFYHQHGYEFQPCAQGTLLDLMMSETNPKFVRYEMDIFWVVYPGQDPVKLLEKYGKRWELMHLKDMKKSIPPGDLSGHANVEFDAALGAGQMNLPAILEAAKRIGVKWYFIEDESSSAAVQIPQSLRFLEHVTW
jgi:sugar phosphate isomerase/epimerase